MFTTNLKQRLDVTLVDKKVSASLQAKMLAPAALTATEKKDLAIALADDKASKEVADLLAAKAALASATDAYATAHAAHLATPGDAGLTAADAAAAASLASATAAKAAHVPMSRNTHDRLSVALADKKAGLEMIAALEA